MILKESVKSGFFSKHKNIMMSQNIWRQMACLSIFVLCMVATGYAQNSPIARMNPETRLPLDKEVRTGKLTNGFTYYIRHNEEPKHRVVMYLVNKVGSVLEENDQRGLAHFMEHMNFNGTVHFPHNELVDYLQKSGLGFGADINAYTSFDETVYQLPMPSDKPEILNNGIEIMHDWAQGALLDSTELEKERGVVLEEKRLGKGAGERLQRQYFPILLNNSQYAVRVPIGIDSVLNNFKRNQILSFYKDWYRPNLQAIIIVGDINVDSLVNVVKAKFADLKNPQNGKIRKHFNVPLTGKNQFIALTDPEMQQTTIEVMIKHRAVGIKTFGEYKVAIIKNLFNQMLATRFTELSRRPDAPFLSIQVNINDFMGDLDMFDATLVAKDGVYEQGFKAMWQAIEQVKKLGFTATELDRAKNSYMSGIQQMAAEKGKTASDSYVGEYQQLFLKGTASPGITTELKITKADLPSVTLNDVNSMARNYIANVNRDILVLAPEKNKTSLPNETTINNWLNSVERESGSAFHDQATQNALLAHLPVSGRTTSTADLRDLNIKQYTLSNGIKVLIKPTHFKNDQVIFNGFAPGGTFNAPDADYPSASMSSGLVASSGIGQFTPDQLDAYLEGKQFQVGPFIGERTHGISGGSNTHDLESAFQMIYAYFTQPRKDPAIFNRIIDRSKAALVNRENDPKSVFQDTVAAVLGNHNERKAGPTVGKLDRVNLDKAYEFYKANFSDASGFTFTFVGNIDTNQIKPLMEKYLGSLPATHKEATPEELDIHIPEGRIERNVYKGKEPKSTVMLVYSGSFKNNKENIAELQALGECLEIRLLERLREDEGGVYSPSVGVNTTKYPTERFNMIIQFGCAPQNVEKLIASTKDEVAKLRSNGPTQESLDKWKAKDKNDMESDLSDNGFWLSYLTSQLQNHEPLTEMDGYAQIRTSITVEKIKVIANECLSGNNFIRLVLLPETLNTIKN
ncbi:M16 family metallopeptidase [Mucilaginibacter pocheonensis]|uniref:Zinc protease n=1 Tax=Mucilaginibacter pocheonensis TaxID=398050 RepID=A0ABU1TEC5_9SPHI|nr:insulinase family protein [Mucilaginibacter pocheonensis]MDR6943752.1 zinc protease [Mucilaginibacter pocheonensis]